MATQDISVLQPSNIATRQTDDLGSGMKVTIAVSSD